MNKIILIVMLFAVLVFGQQINYTFGYDVASGAALTGSFTDLDSTGTTDYSVVLKLNDYYPVDLNPTAIDYDMDIGAGSDSTLDGTVLNTSNQAAFGTLWSFFDADAATDSVRFTVKAYAGVRGTNNESIAGIKWYATAVTLETVSVKNDYLSVKNVYVGSSMYKTYPPEYIKIVYDAITTAQKCNAGTDLYYRFSYPAIYHQEAIQKPE